MSNESVAQLRMDNVEDLHQRPFAKRSEKEAKLRSISTYIFREIHHRRLRRDSNKQFYERYGALPIPDFKIVRMGVGVSIRMLE